MGIFGKILPKKKEELQDLAAHTEEAAAVVPTDSGAELAETPASAQTAPAQETAVETPAAEPKQTEEPTAEAPAAESEQTEEPTAETPAAESGQTEEPTVEAPAAEPGQTEEPTAETRAAESGQAEEPTAETPAAESGQTEEPTAETPAAEPEQTEEPTAETPAAEPEQMEEPTAEAPAAEPEQAEEPTAETPAAESGQAEEPTVQSVAVIPPQKLSATEKMTRIGSGISGIADALEQKLLRNPIGRFLLDALDLMETVCVSAFLIMLLFSFVLGHATVEGDSMLPTLTSGERLLVSRLDHSYETGDILILNSRTAYTFNADGALEASDGLGKCIVKRLIAVGGQTVNIDFSAGVVYVDDRALDEPYTSTLTTRDEGAFSYPLTVPEGYVFVLGDNRSISKDSRHPDVGLIPESDIVGTVWLRFFPFQTFS